MTTTATDTPRVWIGCLACYNAGRLIGEWVDADEAGDKTPADIHAAIADRCTISPTTGDVYVIEDGPCPHEELWCMDHEGFGGLLEGECSPMEAQRIADVLAEVDDPGAFGAFVSYEGDAWASQDWDAAIEVFRERYHGTWDSFEDYAMELSKEITPRFYVDRAYGRKEVDVSEIWPYSCIDWDQAADELRGDYTVAQAPNGQVYVFSDN